MGKRPKSYYIKCAAKKRKREFSLDAGMSGFLLTCNSNEKQCVREAYNILNEYADKLYDAEKAESGDDTSDDDGGEEDISNMLEKEVHALKQSDSSQRRFQVVESGAKNVVFIKTTLEDPCHLVHAILSDLYETKQQKARFIMRMLPIAITCKAVLDKIKESVEKVFDNHFGPSAKGQSFYIIAKIRNNNSFDSVGISKEIASTIMTMNSSNSVDYNKPDLVVLVEILKSNCCMSVVKDYFKFRKYNVHEVAKTNALKPEEGASGSELTAVVDQPCEKTEVPSTQHDLPKCDPADTNEVLSAGTVEAHIKEKVVDEQCASGTSTSS